MTAPDAGIGRFWADAAYFRTAVTFTARRTLFSPRLIEKDYLCTVLLEYLARSDGDLVFKGGTCLSKVHSQFCRLSEDLDFMLPTAVDSARGERSRRMNALKAAVKSLPHHLPMFRLAGAMVGARNSTQYIVSLVYRSQVVSGDENVKVEIGLREPLLLPARNAPAHTVLADPVSESPLVPPVRVRSISSAEAFAEKLRAALSRREPAIRDFFDVDFAVRRLGLDVLAPRMVSLVRRKLSVPGNEPEDISESRLSALGRQVESQLRPVLRAADYAEFDLQRAVELVRSVADAVKTPGAQV